MSADDDFLTTSATARELHLSESAVRKAANTGRLPFLATSTGQRLFRRRDVDAARAARDHRLDTAREEAS